MSHTPSPWTVVNPREKRFTHVEIRNTSLPDEGIIGEVNLARGGLRAPVEGEANARLIAAAPDLLRACETAESVINVPDINILDPVILFATVELLRAAIAKARGTE